MASGAHGSQVLGNELIVKEDCRPEAATATVHVRPMVGRTVKEVDLLLGIAQNVLERIGIIANKYVTSEITSETVRRSTSAAVLPATN